MPTSHNSNTQSTNIFHVAQIASSFAESRHERSKVFRGSRRPLLPTRPPFLNHFLDRREDHAEPPFGVGTTGVPPQILEGVALKHFFFKKKTGEAC
jgi:hypothetical protein